MKSVNISLLIVIALLGVGALSLLAVNGLSGNMSQYSTFAAAAKSGDEVHIAGKWVQRENSSYDSERDMFTFMMEDSTHQVFKVMYPDPMPVNFESADKVVVQGKNKDGVFHAEKIFMKCPSKYNSTEIKQ